MAAFIEAAIWHGTLDAAEAILAGHPKIARKKRFMRNSGDDEAVSRLIAAIREM